MNNLLALPILVRSLLVGQLGLLALALLLLALSLFLRCVLLALLLGGLRPALLLFIITRLILGVGSGAASFFIGSPLCPGGLPQSSCVTSVKAGGRNSTLGFERDCTIGW